ncbi:hypothetical protein Tco_0046592 [Tanacetum coccineum]
MLGLYILNGECPKPPKDKNQRVFVGGSWSDSGEEDDEKVNNETCLVAQASSEVCSESSYFSDENSSINDLVLDNEYDKLCKMSLKIITKNKRLKATRDSLEKEISILKEKVSTIEKNKEVDLECVKCHMLKIENKKIKEEALKLTKFKKSTHCINEMLNNQKLSGEKLGLGFNSFEVSSSETKEIKFVKAQKKVSPDGVDLEPDEWIKDSGCSKHMTGNRKLFSSYKAYNGGNVIFGSNLRGQICDNKCRVTFAEHNGEITKDGKVIGDYVDRKSTSGICTFRRCCLTSWFSKKQTALAISTTEAEYEIMPHREGQVRRIRHEEEIDVLEYQVLTRKIEPTLKPLEEIIQENVFCLGGNQDHVLACLCYMLYYAMHSEKFNLTYFMAKRMEWVTKQKRLILPYDMLLTRLFKLIMNENLELYNESYVLYDCVMNPLAAQQERKPRKDRGTRRGRHSTSSSSAFDQPSPSHLNDDDDDDGNDEGTSRASTPSPIRYVNSLTNQVL